MPHIEIDFEAYQALTMLRQAESDDYNSVIRRLLRLRNNTPSPSSEGATYKGIHFPEGTKFRATYKGRLCTAQIRNGVWVNKDGSVHNSPSSAARAIAQGEINGWRFWHAKRPGDTDWSLLDSLR